MDSQPTQTVIDSILERKIAFLGVFFLVFITTYMVLVAIDFVPESPTVTILPAVSADNVTTVALDETASAVEIAPLEEELAVGLTQEAILPNAIYIEKLDREIRVLNPTSRAIADLDAALLQGVVRHPDSAHLAQDGNVFILGHSSYLPNILNSSFHAFNGIQNLEWGDIIEVRSESFVYVYQVDKVYKATAQDTTVPIAGDTKRLTLATCDSFGTVDDRFVVEAKQIEVRRL